MLGGCRSPIFQFGLACMQTRATLNVTYIRCLGKESRTCHRLPNLEKADREGKSRIEKNLQQTGVDSTTVL